MISVMNVVTLETVVAVDDFSMSPHCFGINMAKEEIGGWSKDMTELEFCRYFATKTCYTPPKPRKYTNI